MTESLSLPERLWKYKSALVLIVANLVPIWGVLFGGWSAFNVVFLFWMENVIIGLFNVGKMLVVGAAGKPEPPWTGRALMVGGMLFMAGFFAAHYGFFCYLHGEFVVALLKGFFAGGGGRPLSLPHYVREALTGTLRYAALALFLSHGFSLVRNYLIGGEYKKVSAGQLMAAPYGRVVLLHIAIILGGFLTLALGSPVGVLLVLVVGKILVDLTFHLKERETGTIQVSLVRLRQKAGGEAA